METEKLKKITFVMCIIFGGLALISFLTDFITHSSHEISFAFLLLEMCCVGFLIILNYD